ncbi:hypothetical protein PVK06_001931 [Gossypium arboreum]|uniref:Uncharacterized protein n=1 Tax=Gossypium arboreum TaxID=29729 RepID=A0ABR0R3D1_GOSAR|nr:hypothetical protein PVK06_001931 [Gossypium arboreum]
MWEENHIEILIHLGTQDEMRSITSLKPFKVSQGSFDKFQLHYLPKERWFKLIKEGKNESDIIPEVPKGKLGKDIVISKTSSTYLNACDYIDDIVDCHSLVNKDVFVLNVGNASIFNENRGIDEHVDEVKSKQPLQKLVVCDSGCPSTQFDYSDFGVDVYSLICYGKNAYLNKAVHMRLMKLVRVKSFDFTIFPKRGGLR